MQQSKNSQPEIVDPAVHPLKSLTAAQFAALGGTAVVFVRPILGEALTGMLDEEGFIGDEEYQLVMSADGTPLFVTDTQEAVSDWLSDKNYGIVPLH
jgi:hypothetical protein